MSEDPRDTLVPEGNYLVVFEKCEQARAFGSVRLFVHFRITEGPEQGKLLLRAYNPPARGKSLARSSNLFLDYSALIGRRPPKKLRPSDFLAGCEVKARVVTVARRQDANGRWEETPEGIHYSKIDRLIEITAGWPSGVEPSRPRHQGTRRSEENLEPEPDLEPECQQEQQ